MAIDPDHCATCYALAHSTVEVTVTPVDDDVRRFTANVPVSADTIAFSTQVEARSHTLARFLWPGGVKGLVLTGDSVTVTKKPEASWDFIEPVLAQVLAEQLTLRDA